jgi:RNA polymerase sigma-70 factor, ECF subfamily
MHTPEEIALLDRIRSGDEAAFRTLYAEHFSALVRTATYLTSDNLLAKDAVQNAFLHFWQRRDAIQVEIALYPYLRRMVINEVLAMQRKSQRRNALRQKQAQAKTFHTDVEDAVHEQQTRAAILAAIDALPERCSEIFKLSRFSEMTYQEIAEALEISVKTVENQMGKALKMLRDSLKNYLYK